MKKDLASRTREDQAGSEDGSPRQIEQQQQQQEATYSIGQGDDGKGSKQTEPVRETQAEETEFGKRSKNSKDKPERQEVATSNDNGKEPWAEQIALLRDELQKEISERKNLERLVFLLMDKNSLLERELGIARAEFALVRTWLNRAE